MSTTLTDSPTELRAHKRRLLHGLPWLVVRQHRGTVYSVLGLTLITALLIVWERHDLIQLLDAAGRPDPDAGNPLQDDRGHTFISAVLGVLPLVFAVTIGAPLIAGDQQDGTAQLVTTQSMTRRQWIVAKLGLVYSLALFSGVVLSVLFTWYWRPHRSFFTQEWIESGIFDRTGPVLPAFLLFLTAAGVTVGVLVRRVLPAMVTVFVLTYVMDLVWSEVRPRLAAARTITFPLDEDLPARLSESYEVDRWVADAQGNLYGWGSCAEATEKAQNACVAEKGIVDNVVEYLDFGQMAAMQWTAAGLLLAGTALLTAVTVWRVSRRPL
ncbi:ABC-2 family transporter protein [Streptomyces sp. ADI96-02]|uniref:ABC transporter permease n=1 Tax=unclassified Streptomyces TaxID=2593676 RepID=UPI000F55567B|nr:ABC transporter permease [Streptomyces sp. ADI96-02]RPK63109.1 ABC-2 family transporter protein [Streptomyces sp. ADI96-02]